MFFRSRCPARGAWRLLTLGLVLAAGGVRAAESAEAPIPCAPAEAGAGRVAGIVSPLDVKLEDGRTVRLSGLGLPAPARRLSDDPQADNYRTGAPGDPALALLERLATGRNVTLYSDGAKSDRHRRLLAQIQVGGDNALWLQRALVQEGAAVVDSWSSNRACARDLLAAESEARAASRGLWSDPVNRILSVDDARLGEGRFAILEGRVMNATKLRSPARVYLNFGEDWRKDFTVRIEPAAVRLFEKGGLDPLALKGAHIRVRGYVGWRAGPEIEATHPEVIEVLEQPVVGNRQSASEP